MKLRSVEFAFAAIGPSGFPKDALPEVALVGKSNVGKSTLINTLVGRKNLARTSSTPGKTRTINFYRLEPVAAGKKAEPFYLVDLPGFGFARAPKSERRAWKKIVESYLVGRDELRGVVVVLDVRRDVGETELELYGWLASLGLSARTVLTKSDKLKHGRLKDQARAIKNELGLEEPVTFSAETGMGKAPVEAMLLNLVRGPAGEGRNQYSKDVAKADYETIKSNSA